MPIKFSGVTKQSGQIFPPGVSLGFADERAEEFFVAAGWAEETNEAPAMTYPVGSVEIDPETRFASGEHAGKKILDRDDDDVQGAAVVPGSGEKKGGK